MFLYLSWPAVGEIMDFRVESNLSMRRFRLVG